MIIFDYSSGCSFISWASVHFIIHDATDCDKFIELLHCVGLYMVQNFSYR